MPTPWDDDRVILLTTLWLDGYSAQQCADRLGGGITRNSVISKVHREGIAQRAKTRSPRQAQRAWHPRKSAKAGKVSAQLSVINGRRKRMGAEPYETIAEFYADEDRRCAEMAALAAVPEVDVAPGNRVGVAGLQDDQCRWPIGDPQKPAEFHFCDHKKIPGMSYCAQHSARAFRPVEPVRRPWSKSNPLLWRTGGADHTYTTDLRTMELSDK